MKKFDIFYLNFILTTMKKILVPSLAAVTLAACSIPGNSNQKTAQKNMENVVNRTSTGVCEIMHDDPTNSEKWIKEAMIINPAHKGLTLNRSYGPGYIKNGNIDSWVDADGNFVPETVTTIGPSGKVIDIVIIQDESTGEPRANTQYGDFSDFYQERLNIFSKLCAEPNNKTSK